MAPDINTVDTKQKL